MGKLSDMVNEIEEGRIDKCNNAWMHEIILELLLEVAREVDKQGGSDKRQKNHEAELGYLCRDQVRRGQEIKELSEENARLKELIAKVYGEIFVLYPIPISSATYNKLCREVIKWKKNICHD